MVWKVGTGDAYALLSALLVEARGVEPLPRLERREGGKPFFPDRPDLQFSLSHSPVSRTESLTLCALSDGPVGCDIEVIRPRSPGLPRYALDDRQYEWFRRRGERWEDFYTLWTLKEARVKCTGEGLKALPREIRVPLLEPGEEAQFEGFRFTALAGETWRGAMVEQISQQQEGGTDMYYIGIDLGGTNVAAGVVNEKGDFLGQASVPYPRGAQDIDNAVAGAIADAARAACEKAGVAVSDCKSLGVASAGSIDPVNGVVLHAWNLGLHGTPLARLVSDRLGLPALLENDANAAALGEFVAGAGKGTRNMVAVTLGTGVGSGAVLDGKLFTGFNYAGMEGGHMVIRRDGRQCTCGRKGCWEAYASATGLILSTKTAMAHHPESLLWQLAPTEQEVNGKTPFDAAQAGDHIAQEVVDEYIRDLACGITNLINLFQPEVLSIAGGVSKQGEALLAPVRAILDQEEFTRDNPTARRCRITTAQLGSEAGTIGAALVGEYR